ncbi:MAG: carboxylating nicotinate-nucleotide diphosphorylase [Candidatus Omnitrophota bacterium]|nr:carboxylating nicotinate-nucleotide diphosphorylase [Candidatus Omnitrophota bacterium]
MINEQVKKIIKAALSEDVGKKDITTAISFSTRVQGEGVIIAKENGVLCGIKVAETVFKEINEKIKFIPLKKDGDRVQISEKVACIKGDVQAILTAERVALNFLSLLSGVCTATAEVVSKVKATGVKILDTRKTTPILRILQRYAVRVGGGYNHRYNLEKGILIKDNHLHAGKFFINDKLNEDKFESLMKRMKKNTSLKVEIEVESMEEFRSVAKYRPDIVMLDNFSLKHLKESVVFRNKHFPKILIEASGGVNLKTVKAIASCGVDFISIGSITHSSKALDFSLEIL